MNYRHSFHAGNFADLVKHALVLWLIQTMRPGVVFDTHAGAGLYDLTGDGARSREAEAGVLRLMTAKGRPALIDALAQRVAAVNRGGPDGAVRFYPGSPVLIADALGAGGRYVGYDLNPPVRAMLDDALKGRTNVRTYPGDGYAAVVAAAARVRAPLILIDPPFEKPDDYVRSAETAMAVMRRDPGASVAIWTPLKDLETFDGFIRRLKAGPTLVAEARLRPLINPMKMNGCAMVVVNPPDGADAAAQQICGWAADTLGDAGGRAEVWRA